MDLDCKLLRVKFQNKNLWQFEPNEYWRQTVSNLSKTKIAFIFNQVPTVPLSYR